MQITCGRCDCCSTPKGVLEKEGLTEFLWAAENAGGDLWSFFQEPGWQVTVMAPSNDVMKAGFNNWGALRRLTALTQSRELRCLGMVTAPGLKVIATKMQSVGDAQ